MKEQIYHLPNVQLNYIESHHAGTPVLLVHGNMGRWQSFSSILPDLAPHAHIYALDLRGHGKSSRVSGAYTIQDHLSDIVAFIQEKIKTPVILFGNSLGGMIGLMAAARYPALIKGLILADAPLSKETLFPIVRSQIHLGDRILNYLKTNQIDKLYAEMNDDFSAESFCLCDPDIFEMTFHQYEKMIEGYELDSIFTSIKCPALIMRGEESLGSMVSDKDIARVIELAPQVEHIKIADAGHSLLIKKEIVLPAVMKFIDRHAK